jgi:hypothetical protein
MPGSYVPFTLAAATSTPTTSDSRYCVHTNTANLNLNPNNFAATVLAPVPEAKSQATEAQTLEPAADPLMAPFLLLRPLLFPQLLFVALHLEPHLILTGAAALILWTPLMLH